MFERLTALFQTKPTAPLPEPDARLALGTLLVRVAKADKTYLFEEISQIDLILSEAFGLNPVEAAKMRATCEKLAATIEDDAVLVDLVREGVDYGTRQDKVAALWKVVLADGITDAREAALVDFVESRLGIARVDNDAARSAASIP